MTTAADKGARPPASLDDFDPTLTHFERLGVEASVAVDREGLESNYLERSKQVHPDRFVLAASGVQRLAMEHAAALNEAYTVVRDATQRAEYLVKLGGIDLDSSDEAGGAPKPTQSFLIDMIERREALESAKSQGLDALEDQRDQVEDERGAQIHAAQQALESGKVEVAARALVGARYLARLIEELERAIEGHA